MTNNATILTNVAASGSLDNYIVDGRVAFNLGANFPVYWYGIIFMMGFGIAVLTYCLRLKFHYKVSYEPGFYYMFVCIPVSILCARLWSLAIGDATDFLNFRQGGLAIQGGVIGGVISALIFFPLILKKPTFHVRDVDADGNVVIRQPSMWIYCDAILPTILLGQALGRWGNFVNGEIFGAESTPEALEWLKNAMPKVFEGMKHFINQERTLFVIYQPLFLYESFGNIMVFTLIYFGLSYIKQIRIGVVGASYFIGYGIIRFSTESARASQFTFTGTYVINSLLLIGGLIAVLIIQFLLPRYRHKWIVDSLFSFMLPKKWKHKFTDNKKPEEMFYYCHK